MKPRNSIIRSICLSVVAGKAKTLLFTPFIILSLLSGFARFEPVAVAAESRSDTANDAFARAVAGTTKLLPDADILNGFGVNPLAKSSRSHNQAALAEALEKQTPSTGPNDLRAQANDTPVLALTKEQWTLVSKLSQVPTERQYRQALRELSGSSRANSLMIGVNPYWRPAFDQMQLRGPNRNVRTHRGSTWRPTQVYQSAVSYDMNGPAPSEYIVPGSMYTEYGNSAPEPNRFLDFNDFLESGTSGEYRIEDSGVYTEPPLMFDGDAVEVEGTVLYEYFGQCPNAVEPIHFWVTPFYAGSDVGSDGNSDSYNISRTGVQFGGHMNLGRNSAFGIVIGYSDPVLSQNYARYTANDYQFGLYGGTYINRVYELKGYLGCGYQDYTSRRSSPMLGEHAAGRTTGSSFAMSFELARPFDDQYGGLWRPFLALDLNNVQQNGYQEFGSGMAFRYDDASLTKTFFRLGANREIYRGNWKIRAGMAYSTQLGGQSTPASMEYLAGTPYGIMEYGVDTARDFIHGNVGLEYFLDRSRRTSLFSDYNVHASKRETDYYASLGFKWLM